MAADAPCGGRCRSGSGRVALRWRNFELGHHKSLGSAHLDGEASESVRVGRAGERLPRLLLALVVLLIPAAILVWKRSRLVAWLLGGAVLYVMVFNLRYAILSGRTYTLSSVASPNDLIVYSAVTAAIALVVSWLVVMLGLKALRGGVRTAAETSLGLTLVVIFLLALPVAVSYVLNGPVVGWTLPEFNSMFLAFISLIQGLMVSVLGILLAGVSALLAMILKSKDAS